MIKNFTNLYEKNPLTKRISVTSGREAVDTVIKNEKFIDVINLEIFFGDIATVVGYFKFL
ncbi:hypothetical protein [Rossellomorea sp. BNER]|uniref:hypothetical protein n=1 Tax=Rossellomorea sp. BNER TaxID=2962031 RepID=UPI003AF283BD|nr:hypothetical protein [Rossellomorea sp. BNER]